MKTWITWFIVAIACSTINSAYGQQVVTAVASPSAICAGSTSTLTASGGNSYTWSTGGTGPTLAVSPTVTTVYNVTASIGFSNNPVAVSVTVIVGFYPPSITFSPTPAKICRGSNITAMGAQLYVWQGSSVTTAAYAPTVSGTYVVYGGNGCGTSSAAVNVTVLPQPVIFAVASNTVLCAGNTATLSAGGGLSYFWTPAGISGANVTVAPQTSTTYTVAGSDGTCVGQTTVFVNVLPGPQLNITTSPSTVICSGSNVTLTGSGAASYTWTGGGTFNGSKIVVSPTQPMLYQLTGTGQNGCTSSTSQVILVHPTITVSGNQTKTLTCPGSSVGLFVGGNYQVQWDSLAGNATTHTVVVSPTVLTVYTAKATNTATGCSATRSFTVNVYKPNLVVNSPAPICKGGNTTLIAYGANSVSWQPIGLVFPTVVVQPSVTTIYTVSATHFSAGLACASSNTVQVTVNPLPVIFIAATKSVLCMGETTILNASGAATYTWDNGAMISSIVISPLQSTVIQVTGAGTNGCVNTATIQILVQNCDPIGVKEQGLSPLRVFPNPSSAEITFTSEDHDIDFSILNEVGQVVHTGHLNDLNGFKIDIRDLSPGLYTIRNNNTSTVQKVLILK